MELFKHQKQLVDRCPEQHLLAWGTGTGKSAVAVRIACKRNLLTLIICPKSLVQNWHKEVKLWQDRKLKYSVITKEQFKTQARKLDRYPMIITDEAHYFAGMKSQMSKSLRWYFNTHQISYRLLLTATPYMSTPWNIYTLAGLLGQKWNYMSFESEFFNRIRMGNRNIPVIKPGIESKIGGLVRSLGSAVRLQDCVDVPDSIYITENFDFTPEQKRAIKTIMSEDFMPIVRWTKIHQICGGTLLGDEYTKSAEFASQKFNRLKEKIMEHKKLIIVARYNMEVYRIEKMLRQKKIPCAFINGSISGDLRARIVDEANNSDRFVLVINSACSEGYNLPTFDTMLFYSYDFSLKNYIQMKGRIQRISNPQKCVYLSFLINNSIDEDVWACIERKQNFDIAIYSK